MSGELTVEKLIKGGIGCCCSLGGDTFEEVAGAKTLTKTRGKAPRGST